MPERGKTPRGARTSISKRKLGTMAANVAETAATTGQAGAEGLARADDTLRAAGQLEDASQRLTAAGASDLTRAVDAALVADRLGLLSEVVAAAGARDVAQGAATAGRRPRTSRPSARWSG